PRHTGGRTVSTTCRQRRTRPTASITRNPSAGVMMSAELLRYWPNETDLGACIKTVAEASSEAVALAVHQPMTFEVRAVSAEGTRTLRTCDEVELLKAFLTDNLPEGRLILLISGDTGVGKSHVIRWLDAQLNRLSGEDRRLVIRIRKGMSLKDILRL